jgi:hypothetical protein
MFRAIKLWFTDRNYYYQRKRYMKLQRQFRNEMQKQAKEFCPWSGYYMHKMIVTMLEFYYKTYEAKDCCWSESAWNGKVAETIKPAIDAAKDLDSIEDLEPEELIAIAQKDGAAFTDFVKQYEEKVEFKIESIALLSGVAYTYLEEKYTKALYNIIGKHIWEWCD